MEKISNVLKEICFVPDSHWSYLKDLAMPENWDYRTSSSTYSYPILRNYIRFTFQRLADLYNEDQNAHWLIVTPDQVCFNTGLLTRNYEEIFMLWKKHDKPGKEEWCSDGFYEESNYKILNFPHLPLRAKYISSIEDLIFNTELKLVPNFSHILEDEKNLQRIPEELRNNKNLPSLLTAEINRLKKVIQANYKIAVPQFYDGKMQFLLPICFTDPDCPDVVLAVEKINDFCYRGNTCLTIDMAYNNARLIAKPETNWLAR